MLRASAKDHRRDLDVLTLRLQDLKDEAKKRGGSDFQQGLHRLQDERDWLAAKLTDIESGRANWILIEDEFGRAWNEFVMNLEVLELELLETAR